MKKYIYISILLLSISFSCRKIYDPDIDSSQNALVVECLITNQAGPYNLQAGKTPRYYQDVAINRAIEAIVKGKHTLEPGLPESFNVLIKELQSLSLDVELLESEED